LKKLKIMGVHVQIDDFGTGYSSLGYLHQFPVNALKIDRSFVSRMDIENNNPEIAQTVVVLAHDLGMETVAEGVETEQQMDLLKALRCEYGQGFLVSKPLSCDEVKRLLVEIKDGNNPLIRWKNKTM
jgi:EAL domain-containing protein (putative c-di-GMP-specific phosphodiesterase class I)